jgi:CRP-like cAMP-binding protein
MSKTGGSLSETKKSALRIFWGQLRQNDRNAVDKNKLKFLKRIPFFEKLRRRDLEEISSIIFERDYQEGEFLFETGQPGAAVFIVASGEIAIEIPTQDGEFTEIASVSKNAFLGELALLDESPRSASARAKTPTKVYALFKSDLDHLLASAPHIVAGIYKALATIVGSRLKATNELLEKRNLKAAA